MQTKAEKAAPAASGPPPGAAPAPPAEGSGTPQRPAVLNIRTVEANGLHWIDIQRPGRAELDWLRRTYHFHPLHLEDVMSKIQRPKLDERDDYIFVVLHWPVYNKITRLTTSSEVDIFVGKDYLITSHAGHLRPLLRLFQQCLDDPELRARAVGRSPGYLFYRIIDRLVDYCFAPLNKIDTNIEQVEDLIFGDNVRRTVYEISLIRRDIIAFRRIVKPQIAVMASLERRANALAPLLGMGMDEYFSDLNDHLSKIWDTLEDHRDVIEGLSDTNDSLTNTRINSTVRLLTMITAVMLPLLLVAALYSLNANALLLSKDLTGFALTLAVMAVIAVGMLAYFKWRRWI